MTAPGPIVVVALLISWGPSADRAAELRARGLELSFNLDHAGAVAVFRDAIDADPGNLAGYRLLTAALWAEALFRNGAISAEDFTGETRAAFQARRATLELEYAAADLQGRIDALAAEQRRRGVRRDVETRHQIASAYRLLSAIAGSIGGSRFKSLGAARRAYLEHQRLLDIDPRHAEALLTVGLYRYFVSMMPPWSRVVARIAGIGSDRDEGVRLIEQASQADGPARASALFSLIVVYSQQARHDDALAAIARLQRMFPRNRLLWLEAARAQLRAGRPSDARASLEQGLRMLDADARPRAFGELARWRFHYGVALAALRENDAARQQFTAALQSESLDWVRHQTRLQLVKLASGGQ